MKGMALPAYSFFVLFLISTPNYTKKVNINIKFQFSFFLKKVSENEMRFKIQKEQNTKAQILGKKCMLLG